MPERSDLGFGGPLEDLIDGFGDGEGGRVDPEAEPWRLVLEGPVEVLDVGGVVADLAATRLPLAHRIGRRRQHHQSSRTSVDQIDDIGEDRTEHDVLEHDREALTRVVIGGRDGEFVADAELDQGLLGRIGPHLVSAGHDHPAEHVAADVSGAGESFGQGLGDGRLARCHHAGDEGDPVEHAESLTYDQPMPRTRNGDVELYYETFGSATDPILLLVNGLGSQSINYATEWCEMFAAEGFGVVRFDNRDTGLSSKLDGVAYTVHDMAGDAVAVIDAVTGDPGAKAHVMGLSMGGMIVQRMAIDHADRLLSMTSVMSRTGEDGYGESTPEALEVLLAPPAESRDEYIQSHVDALAVYGSKPEWIDEDDLRARAGAAFDRCFCPEGIARQIAAVLEDGSRATELAEVDLPVLVLHGSRDTLIPPSGGRQTAEVIPGARYVEIEGMGHDYPSVVWRRWVDEWTEFVRTG